MITNPITRKEGLTEAQLKFLLRKYKDHVIRVSLRKPDRNGHKIEVKFTFDEWLAVWLQSGKLHLRGRGGGKFCMSRHNDLGDYEVGNVSIKSWEENSREAKLGRPGLKGRVSPTKGITWKQSTRDKRSQSAKNLEKFPCEHCAALHTRAHLARHHGPRCKNAPL